MSFSVIYLVTLYAYMRSHLHDTVTLPFPLLLLPLQWIIYNEKEKNHQGYDKKKKKKKRKRITDAITHTATICAWTPSAATAINLLMHTACWLTFPAKQSASLHFCFPDSSLQVVIRSTCLAAEGQLSLKVLTVLPVAALLT